MASPCEMPAGVSGFISFHLMRQHQISQFALRIISHSPPGKYLMRIATTVSVSPRAQRSLLLASARIASKRVDVKSM